MGSFVQTEAGQVKYEYKNYPVTISYQVKEGSGRNG